MARRVRVVFAATLSEQHHAYKMVAMLLAAAESAGKKPEDMAGLQLDPGGGNRCTVD